METGTNAWIANCEFDFSKNDARIDLPGGWHWDISSDKTGYLKTPANFLCVGYDLNENTIRFGEGGITTVPGLNPWTVQEMGEKFARENFMDEATAKEYDAFVKKRNEERRFYERGVREELRGVITLGLDKGTWTATVNIDTVKDLTGIETDAKLTKEGGIALFNQMSEVKHAMPLRDPMGYMVPENNVYAYIKDQYDFQYNDMIDNIDAGFINGSGRGCEAILDKLDSVVRKNIREYALPEGVHYQDLRFLKPTPELTSAIDDFVKHRVTQTVNYEKRRDHSEDALKKDRDKFLAAGERLREEIGAAALPPLDVSQFEDAGLKIE